MVPEADTKTHLQPHINDFQSTAMQTFPSRTQYWAVTTHTPCNLPIQSTPFTLTSGFAAQRQRLRHLSCSPHWPAAREELALSASGKRFSPSLKHNIAYKMPIQDSLKLKFSKLYPIFYLSFYFISYALKYSFIEVHNNSKLKWTAVYYDYK